MEKMTISMMLDMARFLPSKITDVTVEDVFSCKTTINIFPKEFRVFCESVYDFIIDNIKKDEMMKDFYKEELDKRACLIEKIKKLLEEKYGDD